MDQDGPLTRKGSEPSAGLDSRTHLGHDLPTLLYWLSQQGLTHTEAIFDRPADAYLPGADALGDRVVLAHATRRLPCQPCSQQELKNLQERFRKFTPDGNPELLWGAVRDPETTVRMLNWNKLPPDSMAFYRPFHFPPLNQWGIYLLIGPLLSYHGQLVRQSERLKLFSPEVLMHLILFEVFNHEFFHHLVESTATTLEILLATQGVAQPVYLLHRLRQVLNEFRHPHAPLEEALANAYAYNALSFICRVKAGFRTVTVKAYQKAIERYWQMEPAGYREAGHYIQGKYVTGGAHLLAHLLGKPRSIIEVPLSVVAKHVMPGGFTALFAKPDVPTWLVGTETELALFYELVPAPNEAYTQLFWPYNTDAFDRFIEQKMAEERNRKFAQKIARRFSAQ